MLARFTNPTASKTRREAPVAPLVPPPPPRRRLDCCSCACQGRLPRRRQNPAGNHRCHLHLLPRAPAATEFKPPPRSPEPKKFDVKEGQQGRPLAPHSPSLSA